MGREFIDLLELQTLLKEGIERLFPSSLWLKAEIGAVKARSGGHCYMELLQSDGDGMKAKASAVIWSSKYRFIAPYFESVTGSSLKEGMSVLVRVQVSYSQLYGLSLVINDIDPDFSIGEQERRRRMTLERLEKEGLTGMQRMLPMPRLPYRLAVVSSADAAGYRDFMRHLHENEYGFAFRTDLFPALMQGPDAPASIAAAMDAAAGSSVPYDLLLLLRGGGAKLDLACYDDYALASRVAQYPIPVLTAIGHDQDNHVCDIVAFASLKTPTALADELVGIYADEDDVLLSYGTRLRLALSGKLYAEENRLHSLGLRIRNAFSSKLTVMESSLLVIETRLRSADPGLILKKGYMLATDSSGAVIKSVSGCRPGERISVLMKDGKMDCTVEKICSLIGGTD